MKHRCPIFGFQIQNWYFFIFWFCECLKIAHEFLKNMNTKIVPREQPKKKRTILPSLNRGVGGKVRSFFARMVRGSRRKVRSSSPFCLSAWLLSNSITKNRKKCEKNGHPNFVLANCQLLFGTEWAGGAKKKLTNEPTLLCSPWGFGSFTQINVGAVNLRSLKKVESGPRWNPNWLQMYSHAPKTSGELKFGKEWKCAIMMQTCANLAD